MTTAPLRPGQAILVVADPLAWATAGGGSFVGWRGVVASVLEDGSLALVLVRPDGAEVGLSLGTEHVEAIEEV